MARCPDCNGSNDIFGLYGDGVCSHCHGDGKRLMSGLNEAIIGEPLECIHCDGSGRCQTCGGSGTLEGDEREECETSSNRSEHLESSISSSSFNEASSTDYDSDDDSDSDTSIYSDSNHGNYSSSLNVQNVVDDHTSKSFEIRQNLSTGSNIRKQYRKADHRSAVFKRDHRKDHRG